MKSSLIRAFVVAFSFAAVGLLSLSPKIQAADSSSSDAGGMGACCGSQTPSSTDTDKPYVPPVTCGPGTMVSGGQCVPVRSTGGN